MFLTFLVLKPAKFSYTQTWLSICQCPNELTALGRMICCMIVSSEHENSHPLLTQSRLHHSGLRSSVGLWVLTLLKGGGEQTLPVAILSTEREWALERLGTKKHSETSKIDFKHNFSTYTKHRRKVDFQMIKFCRPKNEAWTVWSRGRGRGGSGYSPDGETRDQTGHRNEDWELVWFVVEAGELFGVSKTSCSECYFPVCQGF